MTIRRGSFFVFEGLDRSGKSTQRSLLLSALTALIPPLSSSSLSPPPVAVSMAFPDRSTPIGTMIDVYLKDATTIDNNAIHLLFSANRWESKSKIEELLKNGVSIVCDRYVYSGVAYSAAKGLDMNWCKACDIGLVQPDRVYFLNTSAEECSARGGYGQERYEKAEFQTKVRKQFEMLSNIGISSGIWKIIDANRSVDTVHQEILQDAMQILERNSHETNISYIFGESF